MNEVYTDLEHSELDNELIFCCKKYWLIEIKHPTFIMHQTEPYIDMLPKDLHDLGGFKGINEYIPFEYKAIQIGGKFYAYKLIEDVAV